MKQTCLKLTTYIEKLCQRSGEQRWLFSVISRNKVCHATHNAFDQSYCKFFQKIPPATTTTTAAISTATIIKCPYNTQDHTSGFETYNSLTIWKKYN